MKKVAFIAGLALVLAAVVPSCASSGSQNQAAQSPEATANAYQSRAQQLVTGDNPASPSPKASPQAASPQASADSSLDGETVELSPKERAYMDNYLANLHYMVYFAEKPGLSPEVSKAAVNQANRYLIEKAKLDCVDLDQIEKNKQDQEEAYKAETGGSIDIVQYLAQKLNADVYVELDMTLSSKEKDGKFSSTAIVNMKLYETSTASLLGALSYQTPSAVVIPGAKDEKASQVNAATSCVWELMPKMLAQAKSLMAKSNARGIKHELVIQNTQDAKLMSKFRSKLKAKVKYLETVSSSAKETRYYAFIVGNTDILEDAVMDSAGEVPGLEDLYLVYRRGKSLTFSTGL
jgi:hypothetical protein